MKIIEDKYNTTTKCHNCESVFSYNIMDEKTLYASDSYYEQEKEKVKRSASYDGFVSMSPGRYVKCPLCGEPTMTRHPTFWMRRYTKSE